MLREVRPVSSPFHYFPLTIQMTLKDSLITRILCRMIAIQQTCTYQTIIISSYWLIQRLCSFTVFYIYIRILHFAKDAMNMLCLQHTLTWCLKVPLNYCHHFKKIWFSLKWVTCKIHYAQTVDYMDSLAGYVLHAEMTYWDSKQWVFLILKSDKDSLRSNFPTAKSKLNCLLFPARDQQQSALPVIITVPHHRKTSMWTSLHQILPNLYIKLQKLPWDVLTSATEHKVLQIKKVDERKADTWWH